MSSFKEVHIKKKENLSKSSAYLIKVKFYNIKCKYYNTFISKSKCYYVKGAETDNGRIISAKEIEITLTDIDFNFIFETYFVGSYEIEECYVSIYGYLPKEFINFTLDKYVTKTKLKNLEGFEVEYAKEKNKFNSLYGMSVTNNIRDEVEFDNVFGWSEKELTNEEIAEKLINEKKKGFLSFSWGVWVTAHARYNLLKNVVKEDEYCIYCDTDSMKLRQGYNKEIIDNYNENVVNNIKNVSAALDIPFEKFEPKDRKGKKHLLGVFEKDEEYEEFKTKGAKKYAFIKLEDNEKIKSYENKIEDLGNRKVESFRNYNCRSSEARLKSFK